MTEETNKGRPNSEDGPPRGEAQGTGLRIRKKDTLTAGLGIIRTRGQMPRSFTP